MSDSSRAPALDQWYRKQLQNTSKRRARAIQIWSVTPVSTVALMRGNAYESARWQPGRQAGRQAGGSSYIIREALTGPTNPAASLLRTRSLPYPLPHPLSQRFPTLFASRPQNGPKHFPRPRLDPEWMFATPCDPKIFFNKTTTLHPRFWC